MRARFLRPTILALLVLLVVAGSTPILAGAEAPEPRAATGFVDTVSYGTAWVPEIRAAFGNVGWKTYGWGVEANVKPARQSGYQWVHIPINLVTYNEGSPLAVASAEFCAKSNNGAITRPTQVDLWEQTSTGATRFFTQAVAWPADNQTHCISIDVPDAWRQSLGMSVKLYFGPANGDTITLGKAWAHLVP